MIFFIGFCFRVLLVVEFPVGHRDARVHGVIDVVRVVRSAFGAARIVDAKLFSLGDRSQGDAVRAQCVLRRLIVYQFINMYTTYSDSDKDEFQRILKRRT